MAQIYPIKEDLSELPYSEMKVYDALSKLGDEFYIFHSVQWVKRGNKWKLKLKQAGYV